MMHKTIEIAGKPRLQITLSVDDCERMSDALWSLLAEAQRTEPLELNDIHDAMRNFRNEHIDSSTLVQKLRASLAEGARLRDRR